MTTKNIGPIPSSSFTSDMGTDFTRLSIILETSGGETLASPNAVKTTLETDMSDCNIHAWFAVFEMVLRRVGFSEEVIMRGGCELAFNEMRSPSDMKRVADYFDLVLKEDISDDNDLNDNTDSFIQS